MTTTTSYSNAKPGQFRHLYQSILKQQKGFLLFYTALLLLFITLPNYAANYKAAARGSDYARSFYSMNSTSAMMICVFSVAMPICVAFLLFGYLHNKRAVDFTHSLPVSRDKLCYTQLAAGLTMMILPLLFAQLLSLFSFFLFHREGQSMLSVLGWLSWESLLAIAVMFILYVIAIFVAVSSSVPIELLGYTGAVSVVGIALVSIWMNLSQTALYGYHSSYDALRYVSPLSLLSQLDEVTAPGVLALLAWVLAAVALFFYTLHAYRNRSSEWAEQLGRHSLLGLAVKIFAAAIGSFLVVSMLDGFFDTAPWIYIVGPLLGAPLAYIAVEASTANGFSTIKKSLPVIALSTGLMLSFGLYFSCNGFGYESWLPKSEQVKAVLIESTNLSLPFERCSEEDILQARDAQESLSLSSPTLRLSSPQAIEKVIKLHEAALTKRENPGFHFGGSEDFCFAYETKPFGKKYRRYALTQDEAAFFQAVMIDPEFVEAIHPAFHIIPEHINGITVLDKTGRHVQTDSLNPEKIARLLEAMRKDLQAYAIPPTSDARTAAEYGSLLLNLKGILEVRDAGIQPLLAYTHCEIALGQASSPLTTALLEEWGLLRKEIDYSKITELSILMPNNAWHRIAPTMWDVPSASGGSYKGGEPAFPVKITDPALIKKIMESASGISRNPIKDNAIQASTSGQEYPLTTLYLDNDVLLELLSGSDVKIAYLLTTKELDTIAALVGAELASVRQQNEKLVPLRPEESFLNQEASFSVGSYFEQNFPELLAGRSSVVRKALFDTPFSDENGIPLYYQHYLGIFC